MISKRGSYDQNNVTGQFFHEMGKPITVSGVTKRSIVRDREGESGAPVFIP